MSRVRVLHCLETVGSGGVEQLRLTLARGLDPERYQQALVCTQAIGGLPPKFAEAGCPIHPIGVFRGILDWERYRRCLAVVRHYRPHIIHGAVYEGVALAAVTGRLGRVPVIIGEETSDPVNRRVTGHLLYRALCGLTHQMIGVSPAVHGYLVRKLRIPRSRVALIDNGVARPREVSTAEIEAVREHLGLGHGHLVIGTVGRLFDGHKRVSDLIRALALVRQQIPRARLLVVGQGPDAGALQALAGDLGVSELVLFAGYQPDPTPYYAVMDLFALASAYEAFGLVLVEAMFHGLPVVATRVGGIPHVVAEGETGLLVEPKRPVALAAALLRLLRDPAERQGIGRLGRLRAEERFGAETYVRRVDALYTQLSRVARKNAAASPISAD